MITSKERSILKSKCNTLKPMVNIGKGEISDNLLTEIQTVLYHYELVKVNVLKSCLVSAKTLMDEICTRIDAEPIFSIGNKFVIYKRSDKENIEHIL